MEDDLRDEMQVLDKTWQKMTAKVHQEGFREGADEGRNRSFQQGFDQGYAQGFSTAFTQACFNGALRTLKGTNFPNLSPSLEELTNPHRAMCQMCVSPNQKPDSLTEYKQWQSSVTNNQEVTKKYRAVNELLNNDVINI